MKVILPVAGKGERMRPYTNNLPKCLLPVGGKTIIDWIVEDTLPLKPTETIFITGYKAEKMDEYLKAKPEWATHAQSSKATRKAWGKPSASHSPT